MTSEADAAPVRLSAGDQFPALELAGITGETVVIPDSARRLTQWSVDELLTIVGGVTSG